jgi:membrane fusion protein (multidrug efflux system)
MKRRIALVCIVLLGAGVAGAWWNSHRNGLPAESEAAEKPAGESSALVKDQLVTKKMLPLKLTVFGEIATGKVVAVNVPQAGQVAQLHVLVGQAVHRDEALASLVTDPSAQAAYAQASSAADFARNEFRRNQDLFSLQLATQSQLETAKKQLQDAESNLAAQKKLGGEVSAVTVVAPFDGVVVALPVSQGDRIQAGATIAQLGHTDALRVQLGIEPTQSRLVRVGMPVSIAAVQDPTHVIASKIAELHDVVDPKTQLVTAIVVVPVGAAPFLVAGMRAQATIQLGQREAWAVPRQAVLNDDKGSYLFQVSGGKAQRVEVDKLIETGDSFGVDGKLDPKMPVVVIGNYELEDGMSVREAAQ